MSENERYILDSNGNPPDRKVKMKIKAPEKAVPLSEEEKRDRDEQIAILNDADTREDAASFLKSLNDLRWSRGLNLSRDEIMQEIDPEKMQAYLAMKNAFQTVLRYNAREIALEVDKALEEDRKAEPNTEYKKVKGMGEAIRKARVEPEISSQEEESVELSADDFEWLDLDDLSNDSGEISSEQSAPDFEGGSTMSDVAPQQSSILAEDFWNATIEETVEHDPVSETFAEAAFGIEGPNSATWRINNVGCCTNRYPARKS